MMKSRDEGQYEDEAAFNRRFKYALIGYALIEFIVIVFFCLLQVRR